MAENACDTRDVEAGDQEFNAVLLQRELGASLDHSLQNKKGTVFKGVTVLTLAKATQVPVRPRPCGPGSLTTTEGRGETAEKAGQGHLTACCVPVLGQKMLRTEVGTKSHSQRRRDRLSKANHDPLGC